MSGLHPSELERAATAALSAGHRALYGRAPLEARAWVDAGALLVVVRGRDVRHADLAGLQETIADDVYRATGKLHRPCGWSADSERDLFVLAFEQVPADELSTHRGPGPRESFTSSS